MSETTQTQLPAWAKDAGWTEQDWGFNDTDGRILFSAPPCFISAGETDISIRANVGSADSITNVDVYLSPTSPAAARQCAIDLAAAIKRARGDQG